MFIRFLSLMLILPFFWVSSSYAISNCELAKKLLYRANELHNLGKPIKEQKVVLQEAIELCPSNAFAHNNLANLLGKEKRFKHAIRHYKLALKHDSKMHEAWYGLGKAYYALRQYPLSLKAYSQLCELNKVDAEIQRKLNELVEKERYKTPQKGEVFDSDSLTLLYDGRKLRQLEKQIANCGFRAVAKSIRTVAFENLVYDEIRQQFSGKAKQQLEEIITVIQQLKPDLVEIWSVNAQQETTLTQIKTALDKAHLTNGIKITQALRKTPFEMQQDLMSQINIELE